MKVMEFLGKVYTENFDWCEELEIKHYVPVMEKKKFAIDIINVCTDDIDGFIAVDDFKMHIYFNMKALALYTNLDISEDFNEIVEQYDALCENGTLNRIISLFDAEYNEIRTVLNSLIKELTMQNSIDAQVVRIANKITKIIDGMGDQFDGINADVINEFLNNFGLE